MVDYTIMPMAWNEPGGGDGKRRDPWGKNNDTPPDLDQVFKKFQEKLRVVFGNKKSGGDNFGTPGQPSGVSISSGLLLTIVILLYIIFGFYIVKPAEQGVITRFGKYNRTVGPGPHWYPQFIEQKDIVNTEESLSIREAGTMLTKDENLVSVEIKVQYYINDINNFLFKVIEPEKSLKQAAESALRQAIGHNELDFIITAGQLEIGEQTRKQIANTLDSYNAGIYISGVTLEEVKVPEQVKAAFDDATKAKEDRARFIHEAETYYNKIVPEAKGLAQQMLQEAEAYKQETIDGAIGNTQRFNLVLPAFKKSPQITKTRLYIEALEQVFSNSSKILVDLNDGNNLIYLPLDQLMKSSKSELTSEGKNVKDTLPDQHIRRDEPSNIRSYDRRRES